MRSVAEDTSCDRHLAVVSSSPSRAAAAPPWGHGQAEVVPPGRAPAHRRPAADRGARAAPRRARRARRPRAREVGRRGVPRRRRAAPRAQGVGAAPQGRRGHLGADLPPGPEAPARPSSSATSCSPAPLPTRSRCWSTGWPAPRCTWSCSPASPTAGSGCSPTSSTWPACSTAGSARSAARPAARRRDRPGRPGRRLARPRLAGRLRRRPAPAARTRPTVVAAARTPPPLRLIAESSGVHVDHDELVELAEEWGKVVADRGYDVSATCTTWCRCGRPGRPTPRARRTTTASTSSPARCPRPSPRSAAPRAAALPASARPSSSGTGAQQLTTGQCGCQASSSAVREVTALGSLPSASCWIETCSKTSRSERRAAIQTCWSTVAVSLYSTASGRRP